MIKYHSFLRKRVNTNPKQGPFHHRAPSMIMYRVIRGMLPHKTARGEAALARLKVFEGIPDEYQKLKRMVVPDALRATRLRYVLCHVATPQLPRTGVPCSPPQPQPPLLRGGRAGHSRRLEVRQPGGGHGEGAPREVCCVLHGEEGQDRRLRRCQGRCQRIGMQRCWLLRLECRATLRAGAAWASAL